MGDAIIATTGLAILALLTWAGTHVLIAYLELRALEDAELERRRLDRDLNRVWLEEHLAAEVEAYLAELDQ